MKKIKRNKHFMILILVLILTLGYAAVTTILNMNGSVAIKEGEFLIKFNRSVLNGTNRPTFINDSGNQITFQSADITEIGQSTLNYEIVNMSRQYDVNVQVTCTTDAKNVTITNSNGVTKINSGESTSGTVTLDSTKRLEEGQVPSGAAKLYDKVKSLSSGTDSLNFSSNYGNGVYGTTNTDSGGTIYFYRGQVDNNIIYANKCWNIIRTTETNGVKLFYAGIPVNGSCDQSRNLSGGTYNIGSRNINNDLRLSNLAYAGYMHGNPNGTTKKEADANLTDSFLKATIDDWYEKNIKDTKYEEMLEDTIYCNDRSLPTSLSNIESVDQSLYENTNAYGENNVKYSAATRLGRSALQTTPTLKCANNNDRFTTNINYGNGALKYPIGLITADEAVFAGYPRVGVHTTNSSYLFKHTTNGDVHKVWTMTPIGQAYDTNLVSNYYLDSSASISDVAYNPYSAPNLNQAGINPVVSLKNENYIISGDGTLDNPYILFSKGLVTDKITCSLDIQKIPKDELGEEFDGVRSLYDTVKTLSSGTASEKGIDYNKISSDTNGKGVYETSDTDSGKPVYFYRGDVEDNNVVFADKCWQIVRTTSSSGTKLVYNGVVGADGSCTNEGTNRGIGTSPWNTKYGDNAYTGYMYGKTGATTYADAHTPTNNTDIKTMVDKWYEDNILNTEYEGYLEDVVFCNDRSPETDFSNYTYKGWLNTSTYTPKGYGTSRTLYQGTGRIGINAGITKPTLKCSQLNDRFTVSSSIGNGALTYPIGLMTADETVYAGSTGGFQGKNTEANNYTYYLYIGGVHSWTLTPHRSDTNTIMLVAGAEGNIGNEVAQSANPLVRPVVSIKNDIMVVDGNGSKKHPYLLKTKNEVDFNRIPDDWKDEGVFKDYYVDAYRKLNTLSLDEKIGQLIVAHHSNKATDAITNYNIGGFTYFEADFTGKTEAGVKSMIANEQAASKIPLITAVDEEGGRVVRISPNTSLIADELTKYPNLFYTNTNNKKAWKLSKDLYTESGNNFTLINQEMKVKLGVLKRLGLNVNFAPVVDMAIEGAYISDRVIGLDAAGTAEYAKNVITTSKGTGVSLTMKHFPGYGNNSDTHSSGSVDNKTLTELKNNDMIPFIEGMGVGGEAIMVSHNTVAAIDPDNPSSISKPMHDILRDDLNFTGVIITDALDMGATKDIANKFAKAINAGNNLILVQDYAAAFNEIKSAVQSGTITQEQVDKLVFRNLAWKYYKGLLS